MGFREFPALWAGSLPGALRSVEFLDGEIFYTLKEVQVLTERWRWQYNHVRPHQALGYRPPAPEARDWPLAASREDKQPAIH